MFTDLNRFVQKTSKSLNILYDHRDVLSGFTMEITEDVPVFKGMVDKEKLRSRSGRRNSSPFPRFTMPTRS